jgi:UDP:flavonoid glycosyltransferase YjiC (YdhE family)
VVHVTQGTLETGADDLLKPAIEALAGHDALVVATTGGAPVDALGTLPSNVRAAEFIPHDLLLPRTDVMITNGGWGGVLAALEAGVPMVVVPGELDKAQVARRVARAGAGVVRRTPRNLRQAVDQVLSEPRHRIRELGRKITAAGGAARAAELVLRRR